jgi:hypothetical protein
MTSRGRAGSASRSAARTRSPAPVCTHRWRCEVYDPTGDCLDTFGPGVFGHPGVSLLIAGSLVPSRFTWRTLEGLRCHGD